jgi:hypothetical protein
MKQTTATHPRPSRATSAPNLTVTPTRPEPDRNPQQSVECRADETPVALSDEAYRVATAAAALDGMEIGGWIGMAIAETAHGAFEQWSSETDELADRIREGARS